MKMLELWKMIWQWKKFSTPQRKRRSKDCSLVRWDTGMGDTGNYLLQGKME
jgi:hypothetical protein